MLANGARVIAVEEHFWDPQLTATYPERGRPPNPNTVRRIHDLGAIRLAEMDACGIDVQVISHGSPATQRLPKDEAAAMARGVNDRLHRAIAAHPTRFAAFAVLPTAEPEAAAAELERAVRELGFKGAMINGPSNGAFVDTPEYWPIYARAEKLGVPIYFHPAAPMPAVNDAYYKDYAKAFPLVTAAAWGFTVEAATQAIRLVLSGVFEKHPGLQVMLGHMGETLPFLLWRIDQSLSRPGQKSISFQEIFRRNFHVTTSGFFSDTALACVIAEMSIERVLFAIDWPFVENKPGTDWLAALKLPEKEKAMLAGGNAARLLRL